MKRHQGKIISILAIVLVLGVLGTLIGLMVFGGEGESRNVVIETAAAKTGGFDITIPASGELAALRQTEIRNRLESTRAVIKEIIDEGKRVKKGDILFRLSEEEIKTKIEDEEEKVNNAENALVNANANLDNRVSMRKTELAKADLQIHLAELALQAWEKGEDISERRRLNLDVETADKEYSRRLERFEGSTRLKDRGFTSVDEWKADEIAMIRANADLEQAKLALEVYQTYTYFENKAKKESDLDQARNERTRLENRLNAEVRSAESDVRSRERSLESRQERLNKLVDQLQYCVVESPSDGLVVYYSSLNRDRWGNNGGNQPEIGTEVRANETLIVLPDVSQMVAEVKVNEALSGRIKPGQPATVESDALPGTIIEGEVLSVGVLAEGGGWRDPNRRDYTVRIMLKDADGFGLKPSMRCRAAINVGRVDDATFVPVQSIFRKGPTTFVYVPVEGGYAERAVQVGRTSELFVEVVNGLDPKDDVLLREPRYSEVVQRLDDDSEDGAPEGGAPGNGPPNAQFASNPSPVG
ncbi:MAG: efflux RND transporter periplasmic adaptor subunit [Planctomycetota bacterium]